MDQIYTHDEEILRHSDPANFMTTQDKNLFGISHNWNQYFVEAMSKQIIQAKSLRDMEAALGLSEMQDTDGSSEDVSTPMRMTPKRKIKRHLKLMLENLQMNKRICNN